MTDQQHPIPTTERLPDPGVRVLAWLLNSEDDGGKWVIADCYQDDPQFGTCWFTYEGVGGFYGIERLPIWQPLPPDPTGEA